MWDFFSAFIVIPGIFLGFLWLFCWFLNPVFELFRKRR